MSKNNVKTQKELLKEALVSEEEQPYKVLENWVWVKLGHIVSVKTGKKDANHATEDGRYPFFTCASEPISSPTFSFEGDSIILPGNGANVGLVLYFSGKFEAYQRTYVLQSQVAYLKYIYYHLLFGWKAHNADKQYGSATNYIKLANITEYSMPLPPLNEQKRIADKVEKLLDKINQAKQLIKEAKETFELRRAAILDKAFRGELTKKWREDKTVKSIYLNSEKNNVSFELPTGWKWIKSVNLFNDFPRNGYSPKSTDSSFNTKTLKLGAITKGYYKDNEFKYIDESIDQDSHLWLKNGDFLIQRANSIEYVGTSAIFTGPDDDCIYPDLIMKGKVNEAIVLPQYLVLWINSMYGKQYFRQNATGTAGNMPKINKTVLQNLLVPIPPLEEQNAILKILNNISDSDSSVMNRIEEIQPNVDLLVNGILKKAFSGELGTTSNEDESAIELLKRIT
ncbi:restriction endonuclease subunit S [Paenibacillus oryzisoli]|uniref:Type I restriction modification DNA specificity domain-containing protein n=1 Tax=Paenibacillus oryzisoli TaxID=1850517 RepID=A0A198AIN0_9BACL|nr:restriction endonuclease subunit S [Paenibacillus oryzisoli]OAS21359.1 hypothetical protein A8708_31315 [Paenibacillus oryzisoli]